MSTLGNLSVLTLEVNIPPSGGWFGVVRLDASALPALGKTTLTIGDLALVGSIILADWDDHPGGGRVVVRVRGGAGWRLPVARAGTYGGGSVRLSTVLADLAKMAGEDIVQPAELSLGADLLWQAHRPGAPVSCGSVLHDLVWRGFLSTWRVDPTGPTRFDAWPARGAADGRGRIVDRAGSRGRRTVGLDVSVAAFLPGATLEGVPIARTFLSETASKLTADVFELGIAASAVAGVGASAGASSTGRAPGVTGSGGAPTLGGG